MLCFNLYSAFSTRFKCSKALFSSLSRCDTHHSMFNVMFLESNQETVLACSRYRALLTIFMTGSAGIWTQGLITFWLKLWCSRPFTHASHVTVMMLNRLQLVLVHLDLFFANKVNIFHLLWNCLSVHYHVFKVWKHRNWICICWCWRRLTAWQSTGAEQSNSERQRWQWTHCQSRVCY